MSADLTTMTDAHLEDLHQRLKVAAGHEAWGLDRAELDAQDAECAEMARAYKRYDDACGAVQDEIAKRELYGREVPSEE